MTDSQLPNAVITITDLYRSMEQTRTTIAEMATDIKLATKELGSHSEDIKDHEGRIRVLEKSRWTAYGAILVISAIVSFVSAYVTAGGLHKLCSLPRRSPFFGPLQRP